MKNLIYLLVGLAVAIAGYFLLVQDRTTSSSSELITSAVKQGPFEIYVNATGELEAKKSVKIRGPQGMRSVGIWQTTITDLIPEGTMVKKGDYVADLDKTELSTKMQEVQTEIEKIMTQLEQSKIDTAIELKAIRDEIANLSFSMETEKLEIEKNRFEPEMIIEQSKLKLEKSKRDYAQQRDKLRLKKIQSDAIIGEHEANLRQQQNKMKQYSDIAVQFRVIAPEDGMLIYQNSYRGKRGPGSQLSAWDPVVAELPDLSDFVSVIYVNEVDISKVKKGQHVDIKVDAFPEKAFDGFISDVANIGQQLRNQDAKVFEVTVQVNEIDSVLRPAMTTSNEILVYSFDDVLSIPLEGYQKNDSIEFVVKKVGNKYLKQEVIAHLANDDEIIIAAGLSADDIICLTFPGNTAELKVAELDEVTKQKARDALDVANNKRAAKERSWARKASEDLAVQPSMSKGGPNR
ncbi:MAG: HlyD family efflux transporter periplasmic adaptor subunit [Saprospiraceae bacterium]|nr:HlyD family efflux transporter periplasmic adaptor subunit [Saprospiraceae bacterium]